MQSDSEDAPIDVDALVHAKEKFYFGLCIVVSVLLYAFLVRLIATGEAAGGVILVYVILGVVIYFLVKGLGLGYIRGNGVRVTGRQFPEVHAMVEQHSRRLGMEAPAVFVLQAGGVLNAFATRFLGRNFVVVYSDILGLATQKGERAVSFVVGHELGHIRRKHMSRRALLYPAMLVPFLGSAYSRACEYTCDQIGGALEPDGGLDGLLVLAAGRDLYTKMSSTEFSRQTETERGFFVRFAEIVSSHPHLTKRVAVFDSRPRREPELPRYASPETFAPPAT